MGLAFGLASLSSHLASWCFVVCSLPFPFSFLSASVSLSLCLSLSLSLVFFLSICSPTSLVASFALSLSLSLSLLFQRLLPTPSPRRMWVQFHLLAFLSFYHRLVVSLVIIIGIGMASSSCLPTTGEAEAALLNALISGSSAQEASIPALLQKGVQCKPTSMLPGTNGTDPDSFDLDGYAMLLSLVSFKNYMPEVFNVTIGGLTVPGSSKTIEENHGYRYIGSLNCNINVHAPCNVYSALMWELRACQPAEAGSGGASRTNKKTYPVEALLAAMERADCAFVIVNCYGLEDRVLLNSDGDPELKPSQQYIKNWADESLGFRADIGGVWLNGGCTSYISLPGSPVGIELYPIGVPLQSMASFMRFMKRTPDKCSEYSGGGWKGGTITAQVNFLRATAGPNAEFRISNARSSTAAGAFRSRGVLSPILERGLHSPSSGVTSVVVYNGGQKHNMVSLLNNSSNSSGFDLFGTGRVRGPCRSGAPEEAPLPSRAPWGAGEVEVHSGG